jgi:hypothetical protein
MSMVVHFSGRNQFLQNMGGPSAPRTPEQAAKSILWLATIGPEGPMEDSLEIENKSIGSNL